MAYVSPLIRYHRPHPDKSWLKDYELLALGTLAVGIGAALTGVLYATGNMKLAAALGVTGALVGAVITATQVLGDGARAEAERPQLVP